MTTRKARERQASARSVTPTAHRIRVLIADDHSVVLEGLSAIIGRQPDMVVVAQAADGEEAVALWQAKRPDVTLLDLRMPRLDGVGAIDAIRRHDRDAHVIVLTTFDTDQDIHRALKTGARAYLLKDCRRDDLLECIRRVHSGGRWVAPSVAAKLAERVGSVALSTREVEALELLARGSSNKEIASALDVSETTVKSHIRSIFCKLGVASRTEAVAEAVQRGLVHL
jgi:DNA-binding NarL/FixJ family response regulator